LTIGGLAVVFVWVSIWLRLRSFEPDIPPEPISLRAWDFLGCYHLEIDSWVGETPAAPEPYIRDLMLFADSVDEWGRVQSMHRAVPLTPGTDADGISVRWFTRADTLWFVWSDVVARGGVALRRTRNRMVGRAVAELLADSTELESSAAGWEVNCHSLKPDRIGPVER